MSQQSTGPTRLARLAAKEVPHRKSDRFFAAKSAAKADCEQLIVDVRRSHMHEATIAELLRAAERVMRELHEITLDTPDARNAVVDLDKQIQHLQLAERWVSAHSIEPTSVAVAARAVLCADDVIATNVTATACPTSTISVGKLAFLLLLVGLVHKVRIVQPVVLRASRSRCACCTSASG
jgi:hypothetical protein